MKTKFIRVIFNPEVTQENVDLLVDMIVSVFEHTDITAVIFVGEEDEAGAVIAEQPDNGEAR